MRLRHEKRRGVRVPRTQSACKRELETTNVQATYLVGQYHSLANEKKQQNNTAGRFRPEWVEIVQRSRRILQRTGGDELTCVVLHSNVVR